MTDHEKKLIQAQHRLEEAQMRDRDKERKARTRRLIQTGAILEKAFPQARTVSNEDLEEYLCICGDKEWASQFQNFSTRRTRVGRSSTPIWLARRRYT